MNASAPFNAVRSKLLEAAYCRAKQRQLKAFPQYTLIQFGCPRISDQGQVAAARAGGGKDEAKDLGRRAV